MELNKVLMTRSESQLGSQITSDDEHSDAPTLRQTPSDSKTGSQIIKGREDHMTTGNLRPAKNSLNLYQSNESSESSCSSNNFVTREEKSERTESFLTAQSAADIKLDTSIEESYKRLARDNYNKFFSGDPSSHNQNQTDWQNLDMEVTESNDFPSQSISRSRPASAFMIFLEEFRKTYSEKFRSLSGKEITDIALEVWKDMTKEKKLEFQLQANNTEKQIRDLQNQANKTKCNRPRTAYHLFIQDFLDKEYERRKHMKSSKLTKMDVFQKGVKKWKRMSKTERAIYEDMCKFANNVQDPGKIPLTGTAECQPQ